MLRLVEVRTDGAGKQFIALKGQTDEEAHEMNREFVENVNRRAAAIFRHAFKEIK